MIRALAIALALAVATPAVAQQSRAAFIADMGAVMTDAGFTRTQRSSTASTYQKQFADAAACRAFGNRLNSSMGGLLARGDVGGNFTLAGTFTDVTPTAVFYYGCRSNGVAVVSIGAP